MAVVRVQHRRECPSSGCRREPPNDILRGVALMVSKDTSAKAVQRELRSLEKRIERAEKKIKDLKDFRNAVKHLIEES